MEINRRCRICLEVVGGMHNMFEDESITYKLGLCCGVQILYFPNLPSNICKKCNDILNVAYDFRILCQRSQEYLSDHQASAEVEDQQLIYKGEDEEPSLSEVDLHSYTTIPEFEDEYENENEDKYENGKKNENEDENQKCVEDEDDNCTMQDVQDEEEQLNESDDKKDLILCEDSKQQKVIKKFVSRKPRKSKEPVSLMCNICGNIYTNKATFNYHMKLHKKDKKYECEICTKRFMQTCELRAHMRVHTGEKPFNCSYCTRKFRDRSGVTRHERTHTNERPYGCTICGVNFSYSATLKKHERMHTGEKPYKCMICIKQFSESHQLKAHLGTIKHRELAIEKSKTLIRSRNNLQDDCLYN